MRGLCVNEDLNLLAQCNQGIAIIALTCKRDGAFCGQCLDIPDTNTTRTAP